MTPWTDCLRRPSRQDWTRSHWTVLTVLMQIHVLVNSVVMGRSRMTRMVITDLSVAITNGRDGQSASVFSSFVVGSVLGLRFKCQWKQGALSNSNHVRKTSFVLHLLRKSLSFLFVRPIAASWTKLQNRSHHSITMNIGRSLTNAKHLPLVSAVQSNTFSANVFQENHQLVNDWCLGWSFSDVAGCREFFVIFHLTENPIESRSGHATFLWEFFRCQPFQSACSLFNRFKRGKVVGEAVGLAFLILSGTKQTTFSFAMFDCGSQHSVFCFFDTVAIIVLSWTVKPMLQAVVQKTVQMPWKQHSLRKLRHAVAFAHLGAILDANDCNNPLQTP